MKFKCHLIVVNISTVKQFKQKFKGLVYYFSSELKSIQHVQSSADTLTLAIYLFKRQNAS